MVPFEMVVRDVFTYSALNVMLAHWNNPVEACFLDCPNNRSAYEFALGA